MICGFCGVEQLAMKTVRFRRGVHKHTCCDECWQPISGAVWVVRGHHDVFGRCESCGDYASLRDLADLTRGAGKRDFSGTCPDCVR